MANKGAGRPLGSPNKATADARQAIATFVDGNAHRLVEWLNRVSDGVKTVDPETGDDVYVVQPNPAKAFEMFQSVVEYHVPKLARTELVGDDANPVVVEANFNIFGELLKNIELGRQSQK